MLPSIDVRPGLRSSDNDLVLTEGGVISGTVRSTNGSPIEGAQVVVRDFGDGVREHRAVSDLRGRFKIGRIIAKTEVELEVTHSDFRSYNNRAVTVGETNLEVRLKSLGGIVGVVVDPKGQPANSFTVQLERTRPKRGSARKRLRSRTYDPRDGRFDYKGIADGVYSVIVRTPKFSTATLQKVEVRDVRVVDVGKIRLVEGGEVFGTVVGQKTGAPVEGVRVYLIDKSGRSGDSSTTTDEEGAFRFETVKTGAYSVKAQRGKRSKPVQTSLVVGAGSSKEVRLRLVED